MNSDRDLKNLSNYLEEGIHLKNLKNQNLAKDSIFITARYRTGSTYLYSLFSSLINVVGFYEPLNSLIVDFLNKKDDIENQKFKYRLSHTFNGNYFSEYKSLEQEIFMKKYKSDFGMINIVMSWMDEYEELKDYVAFLISSHPGKLKMLQFNRIDFRLAWFKVNFSKALIVNLRRNPRDVYSSYIGLYLRWYEKDQYKSDDDLGELVNCIGLNVELNALCEVSIPQFSPHDLNNYEKIYLLNQLSNHWADRFADLVIEYESLVQDPVGELSKIVSQISNFELNFESELIEPRKDRVNVWQEYQPESWFKACEAKCDNLIEQIL